MSENIKINVNGNQIESAPNKLLIEACEDSGIHIPRFCWHKRLDPVGMCRMCLVEIETPRGKMLVPSCTTEVTDEMVVDTESEVVKKAQEGVLEFLLINHPLDCPVCDKAGECPLQDQTMAYGPGESRFDWFKALPYQQSSLSAVYTLGPRFLQTLLLPCGGRAVYSMCIHFSPSYPT